MTLTLQVEKRAAGKKATGKLKREGKIPAVLYGPKEEALPIALVQKEFEKVWREAGESTVIELKGLDEEIDVLIHEVDIEPVRGEPRHADFYVPEKGKKVEVEVPLEFEGTSPAEKAGGVLIKVLHEVSVEALPKNLPHEIVISVEGLTEIGSQLHVSDLPVPQGVTILNEADEVVALIQEAKEEPEEEPQEVDMSAIEVEKRGKDEETAEGESDEKE